jgi:hypothetical protein
MGLEHAKLVNVAAPEKSVQVLFNPTEYSIDQGMNYAELQVPGLQEPILQFVRGEAKTLSLELFLDGTNRRVPVEDDLEKLQAFVRIDGELHAPPVCRFEWGKVSFEGVVISFKEKFNLFAEDGKVLRARVTLTIKSYRPPEVQLREQRPSSPDRSRVRVLREGETLAHLADAAYGDPRLWRLIAKENGIDRPRFVAPGTPLRIPSVQYRSGRGN